MRASATSTADHRTVTAKTSNSDRNHAPALFLTYLQRVFVYMIPCAYWAVQDQRQQQQYISKPECYYDSRPLRLSVFFATPYWPHGLLLGHRVRISVRFLPYAYLAFGWVLLKAEAVFNTRSSRKYMYRTLCQSFNVLFWQNVKISYVT